MRRWGIVLGALWLSGCSGLLFYPEPGQPFTPERAKLDYRDVALTTADGVRLHGWWLPAKAGVELKGTVLHLHGNGGNLAGQIALLAHHFGQLGCAMQRQHFAAHVVPAQVFELVFAERGNRRLVCHQRRDLRTHRGLRAALAGQQRRAKRGKTGFGHGLSPPMRLLCDPATEAARRTRQAAELLRLAIGGWGKHGAAEVLFEPVGDIAPQRRDLRSRAALGIDGPVRSARYPISSGIVHISPRQAVFCGNLLNKTEPTSEGVRWRHVNHPVTDKPDLATPIAANIDLPASRPHRMFDQASGAMVDCEKRSRNALEAGRTYPGPLLVIDEGSSLAIHGNQSLSVDQFGMLSIRRVEN